MQRHIVVFLFIVNRKPLSTMKKFLEVLLDDNGEMHISAEDLVPEMEDPCVKEKTDALFKAAIKAQSYPHSQHG